MNSHSHLEPSAHHKAEYMNVGAVCVSDVFGDLLSEMRSLFEAVVADASHATKLPPNELMRLVNAWSWKNPGIREMVRLVEKRLLSVVAHFAKVEDEPVDSTLFVKSNWDRAATHAHQDIAYRWNRPTEHWYALTTWLAIDTCDENSGALSFLPGSHRQSISPCVDFLDPRFRDRGEGSTWKGRACMMPVKAGDIVIFDSRIWHAAAPLRSGRIRRALAIRWANPNFSHSLGDLPRPLIDHRRFGMYTSGEILADAFSRHYLGFVCAPEKGSMADTVRQMIEYLDCEGGNHDSRVKGALVDLANALLIERCHHGRASGGLWRRIRDETIPLLDSESAGGTGR